MKWDEFRYTGALGTKSGFQWKLQMVIGILHRRLVRKFIPWPSISFQSWFVEAAGALIVLFFRIANVRVEC